MDVFKRNINNIFLIFILSHLIIWTLVPTLTNYNLPLDTIETLAWGSNLEWGFNKHPPASAFFSEIFFQTFGSQDWAYYLLSQLFVCIAFIYVFNHTVNRRQRHQCFGVVYQSTLGIINKEMVVKNKLPSFEVKSTHHTTKIKSCNRFSWFCVCNMN